MKLVNGVLIRAATTFATTCAADTLLFAMIRDEFSAAGQGLNSGRRRMNTAHHVGDGVVSKKLHVALLGLSHLNNTEGNFPANFIGGPVDLDAGNRDGVPAMSREWRRGGMLAEWSRSPTHVINFRQL